MKKLLTVVALVAATITTGWSQAEVVFSNFGGGVNAPFSNAPAINAGATLSGTSFLADLFYGTTAGNNNLTLGQLTDAGLATPFQAGGGAGYFLGGGQVLPVSGNIEFIIVVWQAAAGASWATATGSPASIDATRSSTYSGHGGTEWGASAPITFTPNVSPAGDSPLNGLTGFALQPVPEPTTLALGGLGAAALLMFRRRK
jgi:hypothetical protein